jgi:phosphatidyl-myo-inositol dimannoside synthase
MPSEISKTLGYVPPTHGGAFNLGLNIMAARGALLILTHEFPPFPGGVARYCASIAYAAARLGYEVTVLAPAYGGSTANEDIAVHNLRVVRFPGDVFDIRNVKGLRRVIDKFIRKQHWHVVHAADWPMILALKRRHGFEGRMVASLHGSDVMVLRHSWRARFAGAARRLQGFDRYVCNSRYTAALFARSFPKVDHEKADVALLGVDDIWFDTSTDQDIASLKQHIDYQESDLIVLTVARIDPRKGHVRTIHALSLLPQPIKARVKYVCIGLNTNLTLTEEIASAAKEAGVRVCVTGPLPMAQVRAAYSIARVFALSAEPMERQIEGFGLVLLEAAAQGLPSVVTAVHAIPEVVIDGVTGWICEANDSLGTSRLIHAALTQTQSQQMRDDCIAHARSCTWDACAKITYRDW